MTKAKAMIFYVDNYINEDAVPLLRDMLLIMLDELSTSNEREKLLKCYVIYVNKLLKDNRGQDVENWKTPRVKGKKLKNYCDRLNEVLSSKRYRV